MTFQQIIDPRTGEVSDAVILYTDENGTIWTVPDGHRFWGIYQDWLAEGNSPKPAE